MAPKPAPIAAKAHRPSILRAAVRVSVRRAATICTAMSNLFTSRCGEDGGLPLRHDFSTRETYYSCSPLTEISETRQATRQSRREFGGDKGPVHNLGDASGHQRVDADLVGRRCSQQDWHIRHALMQCSSQIECRPGRCGMAHQQRVESFRYRSARRQRIVRSCESDRLISARSVLRFSSGVAGNRPG